MKYDAIVIGAGNGGLMAALTLQKEGKEVLILDSSNMPGGFASSFIRGRFEFETSLQVLFDYGTEENHGPFYELLKRAEILDEVKLKALSESYYVKTGDNQEYIFPFGQDDFILKMEEYVPQSKESMRQFFELSKEVTEGFRYMNESKKVDVDELKEKYPNFMIASSYSVKRVLESIKMPEKAQEILMTQWGTFGSPSENLSFVSFATMIYSYITYGGYIPVMRSHEISLALLEKFESYGGSIRFLSRVTKLIFENDKICGVRVNGGSTYYADHIISNISPSIFYSTLLPKEMQTDRMREICNARTLGARGFSIFLGLNRSANDLGLNHYRYFLTNDLDHKKAYQSCQELYPNYCVATVLNQALPNCSSSDTTILTITSLYTSDIFSEEATEENYYDLKNKIANHFIDFFEKTTNLSIREAIEEIEIASPATFARYGGHPDGCIYGYMPKGYDNVIPRMMNEVNENCLMHVHFCGGFASRLSGYYNTYFSGELAALKTLQDMKREEGDEDEITD